MAILFERPLWERRKEAHHSSIHDCSGDERAEIYPENNLGIPLAGLANLDEVG